MKGFVFAEKVKLGEDRGRRNGLQVGKLPFYRREMESFCDVVKESAFEQKNLTEMRRNDVLTIQENDAELVVKQTCKMEKKNVYGCWT